MDSRLTLTLDAGSLAPFHDAWRRTVERQGRKADAAVLDAAERRLGEIDGEALPTFVRERVALVPELLALLRDRDWDVDDAVRRDLAGALAYLTEPFDLIPDSQPRYGLLDDALVLDLAVSAHRGEWEAWRAFAEFRRRHCGNGEPLPRNDWLSLCRQQQRSARRSGRADATPSARFHRETLSYVTAAATAPRERFDVH